MFQKLVVRNVYRLDPEGFTEELEGFWVVTDTAVEQWNQWLVDDVQITQSFFDDTFFLYNFIEQDAYNQAKALIVVEVDNVTPLKRDIINYIDSTVDAIYAQAVGNRTEEYKAAEADAIAFKDSGYTDTAGTYITGWAQIKGWSDQQACDDILYQANAWRTASIVMRQQRLSLKEAARLATDEQTLVTIKTQAVETFKTIKQQLGLEN